MKPSNPIHPLTLVAIVRKHAVERPDEILYRFLPEGEDREQTLTFGELDESASTLASLLLTRRGKGERALLLYPDGLEYLKAFFGCLYAGVIAVPAYPPRRNAETPGDYRRLSTALCADGSANDRLGRSLF